MLKTKPKTRLAVSIILAITIPIWFGPFIALAIFACFLAIFACIVKKIYELLGE